LRTVALFLSALVVGAAVWGCQLLHPDPRTPIRLANWGGASEENDFTRTIDRLYREFEQENPGYRIKIESVPGSQEYVNKMLLSFVAGTEPDLMTLDASSAAVFIRNGVLQDLRPYIATDPSFDLDAYFPNVLDTLSHEGGVYAIPADFTPMVMYYNKRLFDEAGVPYPQPGWSYKDFLETAKRLTLRNPDGSVKQYGFKFVNWMPGWITWIWNNDADVLSPDGARADGYLNSPKSVEALSFLRDLISVHGVAPTLSQAAAMGVDPFAHGRAAMMVSGHWELVGLQSAPNVRLSDLGVVELPTRLPQSVAVMYQVGYAMGRNTKNPQAAWELIKFLTSHRFQSAYQATGVAVAGRKDVAQERVAEEPLDATFLQIIPSGRGPWGAQVEGYDFVEQAGQQAMERILAGADVKQALDEAVRRIDRYFAIR
jgi:multiple sugar transport system substrate-binding protein